MSFHPLPVAGVLCCIFSSVAASSDGRYEMPIANFGFDLRTSQGGFYRAIGGRPTEVSDRFVAIGKSQRPAWRVDLANEAPRQQAGAIVPLFDNALKKPSLVNLQTGDQLVGQFAGDLGKRKLQVEFLFSTDPETRGIPIGTIPARQLHATKWKTIKLPISVEARKQRATFLRFTAEGPGECWFAINTLKLVSRGPATEGLKAVRSKPQEKTLRKALWHWHTKETLPYKEQSIALLELCQAQGITDLYCQVPYSYEDEKVELHLVEQQREFNSAALERGIAVHVLDGDPSFIFQRNHSRVIRLIEAIEDFNKHSVPRERYRGIHLDNEPHVLKEWQDDQQRSDLIYQYIQLNRQLSHMTKSLDMDYGVDIPFWWDAHDSEGRARFTYDSDSRKQPILEVLFPLLDNVGVMSYRDRVTGPNGVVAHCLGEFELGERLGTAVFASVELGVGPDVEPGTTFGVHPWRYFRGQLDSLERILAHLPGCAGLAIHHAQPFAEAMK